MFDQNSRYIKVKDGTVKKNGNTVNYKKRRFLPQGEKTPLLIQVSVMSNDRIDLIASRTFGIPDQFWRICDKNNAMYPLDLTAQPGRQLDIPILGR
jgi:hypothetical protein